MRVLGVQGLQSVPNQNDIAGGTQAVHFYTQETSWTGKTWLDHNIFASLALSIIT